jgi:hypothetical protein
MARGMRNRDRLFLRFMAFWFLLVKVRKTKKDAIFEALK